MYTHHSPRTRQTMEALWRLHKIILDSLDYQDVTQKICDGLLHELNHFNLGYKIIVLALANKQKGILERISLSQTEEAAKALAMTDIRFKEMNIPFEETENHMIKTLNTMKPHIISDWHQILRPVVTAHKAQIMQDAAGIKASMLYPIVVKEEAIGVVVFSMTRSEKEVSEDEIDLIKGFCEIIGLSVQNAQLYSAQQKIAKRLQHANEKLKQLDKMKDEFVSLASHELRTPMTSIRNYLWMALYQDKEKTLTKKQKFYLQRSYSSTERLITLVNDILNISRIESGRMTVQVAKVHTLEMVRSASNELEARAEEQQVKMKIEDKALNLKSKEKTAIPDVVADVAKIAEVLINLIGNAIKFTPPKGTITTSFSYDHAFVYIHVTDTGAGIEPSGIDKLFVKFGLIRDSYRGNKDTVQGTGLGLYLSKSLVDLHKGKIWVNSEGKDKGSTFSFSLPKYSLAMKEELEKQQAGKPIVPTIKRLH